MPSGTGHPDNKIPGIFRPLCPMYAESVFTVAGGEAGIQHDLIALVIDAEAALKYFSL